MEIGAREGSYKDMPATRCLSLVLGGMQGCPSASMDGTALECRYNAETLEASIVLPEHPADQAVKVIIRIQ